VVRLSFFLLSLFFAKDIGYKVAALVNSNGVERQLAASKQVR
jgi:hypothetical protein